MTREEFGAYVQLIAGKLRLGHWTIKIGDTPPKNADAWASVTCWEGRFGATVYLSDQILSEPPEEQRYVAVHELVHCFFAHSDRIAEADMSSARNDAWRLAMEYGVDAVAEAIAPHMPLPLKVTNGPTQPA